MFKALFKNLDIEHGSRLIVKALDFKKTKTWHAWAKEGVSEQQAMFIFAEAAGCLQVKTLVADGATSWADIFDGLPRFNSGLASLWLKWPEYRERLGRNRWAVYNTHRLVYLY